MTAKTKETLKARLRREIMAEYGHLGGTARRENLTPAERSASARKAAKARWAHLRRKRKPRKAAA